MIIFSYLKIFFLQKEPMGFELRAIYKAGESESIERWTNTLLVQSGITRPTDRSPQTCVRAWERSGCTTYSLPCRGKQSCLYFFKLVTIVSCSTKLRMHVHRQAVNWVKVSESAGKRMVKTQAIGHKNSWTQHGKTLSRQGVKMIWQRREGRHSLNSRRRGRQSGTGVTQARNLTELGTCTKTTQTLPQ